MRLSWHFRLRRFFIILFLCDQGCFGRNGFTASVHIPHSGGHRCSACFQTKTDPHPIDRTSSRVVGALCFTLRRPLVFANFQNTTQSSQATQTGLHLFAILSGLAAALCYAGYILVSSRYQNEIEPLTSGFYVMLFATIGLFAFHRPDPMRLFSLDHNQALKISLVIAGIAFICTVTPLVLFLSGLQKLGNTEASLLSTIEPVTAAALGSLVLQETLSFHEWLGGAIVLTALVTTVLGSTAKVSPAQALD
jgi:drug/metabolite transporter (DMT)-like permease